jgi:hypothetical protein
MLTNTLVPLFLSLLLVGQCNFEVRDAVENGLSEAEAEEKSRPFLCQVGGGCTKRYRQVHSPLPSSSFLSAQRHIPKHR